MSRTKRDPLVISPATQADVVRFNSLINSLGRVPLFRAIFGAFNFSNIVDFSLLSLIASTSDVDESAVGFVSVNDACTGDYSYNSVLLELQSYLPVKPTNSLFITFWAVEERASKHHGDAGTELVKKIFLVCQEVDFLIWLCPTSVKPTEYQKKIFEEVVETDSAGEMKIDSGVFKNSRVFILRREKFIPKLLVREARIEDNDDILPILRKSHPEMVDGQESYFLADLIQSRDESNKLYVGISEEDLVGVLAVSTNVNVSLVRSVFDVDIFSDVIVRRAAKAEPPTKKVAVIGNTVLLPISGLSELAAQLDCVIVDANDFPLLGEGAEDIPDGSSIDVLDRCVTEAVEYYKVTHDNIPPVCCLITGFPRTDRQASDLIERGDFLDTILDLGTSVAVGEAGAALALDADADAFLLRHLDAAETLRRMHFSDDEHSGSSFKQNVHWEKLIDILDESKTQLGDTLTLVTERLSMIVADRSKELEEFRMSEKLLDEYYPNAFAITMFCTEDGFETQARDMLRVAFEDFQHLDYCLCMLPNTKPVKPLVELMTPIKMHPGASFDQSLYVLRKEALVANEGLEVVRLNESLLPSLRAFLGPDTIDSRDLGEVMNTVNNAMKLSDTNLKDNPAEVCFVVVFDGEVVGVISLSRRGLTAEDIVRMRATYELDNLIDYDKHRARSQSAISQWLLSPVFSRWARFIFRDLMRQCEKSVLYFQGVQSTIPAAEIVMEMLPVPMRRRVTTTNNDGLFLGPLYVISKSQLSNPKTVINSRIVVVGGTNYAHSVLEVLCFSQNLSFSNLYVVAEDGGTAFSLGGDDLSSTSGRSGGEFSGCLSINDCEDPSKEDIHSMGLPFKASLVRGHLTDIDRDNKSIIISDEVALAYDILVIASPTQDNTVRTFPATKGMHPSYLMDRGLFGLGNPRADTRALQWVMRHISTDGLMTGASSSARSGNSLEPIVIVYGSGLDALAALGGLRKCSVPASSIVLVMPESEVVEVGHTLVNETISIALRDSGINVYMGFNIVDVKFSSNGMIESVEVEMNDSRRAAIEELEGTGVEAKSSYPEPTAASQNSRRSSAIGGTGGRRSTVKCATLLCCGQKQCEADVFAAINDSGLVYDGGVVVDEVSLSVMPIIIMNFFTVARDSLCTALQIVGTPQSFRTVDKTIYSLGKYTKFSRVYRDQLPHAELNSKEVGSFVANRIIESLLEDRNDRETGTGTVAVTGLGTLDNGARVRLPIPIQASKLPSFARAKSVSAHLPGGLVLFHSASPMAATTREFQPLITGEPGTEKLCVLKLDYLGVAIEFTYVGTDVVEENNLACLVGVHESYLGCALHSYEHGLVRHWVDFFSQDWAGTVHHDKLWDLIRDLRSSLLTDKGMLVILEKVFDIAASTDDDQVVGAARQKIIGDNWANVENATRLIIEARSVDFLKRNKQALLKYYVPSQGTES